MKNKKVVANKNDRIEESSKQVVKSMFKKNKNNTKLRVEDIKKNSSSDVSHTIKKIKTEENRIVAIMVIVILLVVGLCGIVVFVVLNADKENIIKSGPLVIEFSDNETGMSDIINFTEKDGNPGEEGIVITGTQFTIVNDKGINSWYAVYLDDYMDMIKFDQCNEKQLSKEEIYFSIDNSDPVLLSSVSYDDRYVLTEGIVLANDTVTHDVKVWHMDYSENHYHGKIVVKYLR